jgi:acyl-CoA thioesterase YciA
MSTPYLALQVIMMPRDANPMLSVTPDYPNSPLYRTIFGGVLLSYIDQAGAVGAIHEVVRAGGPIPAVVTVAINRVEFKQPVLVGDVVRFLTRLVKLGRTSVTIHVNVEAERGGKVHQVTEAELVYVGIDKSSPDRRPKPLLPEGPPAR